MTVPRVLLDTAVPLLALGEAGPMRRQCQEVLTAIADGRIDAVASTEMIQELVFHRLRKTGDRLRAVQNARDTADLVTIVDFDSAVLDGALRLIESPTGIRGRDAVHAATALAHGIDIVISPDDAFDSVPGLTRVDPASPPWEGWRPAEQ